MSEPTFEFKFSADNGQRLRSVAIVNGVPEFRFDPYSKVPSLTEDDVADAFRLALEGKRPEFYYIPIPPTHPLFGRQYKQYIPEWLEGTSIGETLSEADWAMKCLTNGLRSNDSKTEFWAWEKTSQLTGLVSSLEFENDKSHGSVIMSCDSLRVVHKGDWELEFPGEPRLHINSESNAAYSRYINRVLPSVAYHDEPLFLKFGEILKLIVAAEWIVKKGVKISRRWLQEHASKPKQQLVVAQRGQLQQTSRGAPRAGTPPCQSENEQGDAVPSRNVAVKKGEAKHLSKRKDKKVIKLYGSSDFGSGEVVLCDENGYLNVRSKSLKMFCETRTSVNGKPVGAPQRYHYQIPFMQGVESPLSLPVAQDSMSSHVEFRDQISDLCKVAFSMDQKEATMTVVADNHHPDSLSHSKTVTVVRASWEDYDLLYNELDPNLPIRPNIPGICEAIVPNASSWNELFYNKTVPWPHVSSVAAASSEGQGGPSAVMTSRGGVTARSIPVVEDRRERETEVPARAPNGRTVMRGTLTRRTEGSITLLAFGAEVREQVVQYFQQQWIKGPCPTVRAVITVSNTTIWRRWEQYKLTLPVQNQRMERHFHGTSLNCDILSTSRLCTDTQCGVCGVSDGGFDHSFIQTNIEWQRFGSGFYLAPNSSKCNDYTKTTNGYKAMLLCDVLPGNKYRATSRVNGPPRGYDSVEGVVSSQTGLNYPEILIVHREAILPRFIIIYN